MLSEIIEDLKGENNFAFGNLYKSYFGIVDRFVTNNNGTTQDAEDLFQDTMIVLIEKLRMDGFQLTASIKTYIMAIAKNLWLKKLRNKSHTIDYDDLWYSLFYEEINTAIDAEKSYLDKLQSLLHKITKRNGEEKVCPNCDYSEKI